MYVQRPFLCAYTDYRHLQTRQTDLTTDMHKPDKQT
jgi:hypothetical protein